MESPSSAEQTAATAFAPTDCETRTHGQVRPLTCFDLFDNLVGVVLAHIVDDDIRTQLSEHQSVASTETSASAGNNDRLAFEVDLLALRVGRELF